MAETFWQRLRKSLGIEQVKPEGKVPTASEQKALDRAIPRRFEPTVPPKPKPPAVAPKKQQAKPVKSAKPEKDVTSSIYSFRELG